MPPPYNDAPTQNKHNRVGPAPDRPKLPAVAASPFAAARSLPSGKDKKRVLAVDKRTTLEEQQRRFLTASVIRDWEISAWYSIAGRESIPQTRLRLMKRLIRPNIGPVEDEDWADVYDGEEPRKVEEASSIERRAVLYKQMKESLNRKRK